MNKAGKKQDDLPAIEEQLAKMEFHLQKLYCQIGIAFLEIATSEQKSINTLVDDIIKTRKRIAKAKREIQCPQCMSYHSPDSNYCSRCGQKISATNTEYENTAEQGLS